VLFIVLDPFQQDSEGNVRPEVSEEQLKWMDDVLQKTKNKVKFRILSCHIPILKQNLQYVSSSRISLQGETGSDLWQMLKKHNVDLYLCGEYHAVSCQESDGILQIVHGALMGFSQYLNYLVVTVEKDELLLEIKGIETVLEKPEGEPDRLSRIARISDKQLNEDAVSLGTMKVSRSRGARLFTERTGVFAEYYTVYPSERKAY
jgi:3',5'-cyclic AMP phosphodiesterase CpdA